MLFCAALRFYTTELAHNFGRRRRHRRVHAPDHHVRASSIALTSQRTGASFLSGHAANSAPNSSMATKLNPRASSAVRTANDLPPKTVTGATPLTLPPLRTQGPSGTNYKPWPRAQVRDLHENKAQLSADGYSRAHDNGHSRTEKSSAFRAVAELATSAVPPNGMSPYHAPSPVPANSLNGTGRPCGCQALPYASELAFSHLSRGVLGLVCALQSGPGANGFWQATILLYALTSFGEAFVIIHEMEHSPHHRLYGTFAMWGGIWMPAVLAAAAHLHMMFGATQVHNLSPFAAADSVNRLQSGNGYDERSLHSGGVHVGQMAAQSSTASAHDGSSPLMFGLLLSIPVISLALTVWAVDAKAAVAKRGVRPSRRH